MNRLAADLDHIFISVGQGWEELRGKKIFITGGTGFFGSWLLESLVWANGKLKLGVSANVLTRDAKSFQKKMPHLANQTVIKFLEGDVRNFDFPKGEFPFVIHAAATSARATFNNEDPLVKFDTVVNGTKRVLEFAASHGVKKFLYTSSGAVYGMMPPEMANFSEDYPGAPYPADVKSAWGESKRAAEFLCGYYANKCNFEVKIARCFSFVGPYLPLDIHYAIGNFIRDALNGGPVKIAGDGTAVRSYLYAADLAIWLWTLLLKGQSLRVYNVGSDEAIDVRELAALVVSCAGSPIEIRTLKKTAPGGAPDRYVPSIARAREELGLERTVELAEAVKRTIDFNKSTRALS